MIHVHEPMTPAIAVAALATWRGPTVGTFHASGDLGWMRLAAPVWGFLADRIDTRIAVSEQAEITARRWLGGEYTIVPNGVFVPEDADPAARENSVVFIGRHEARKGMHVLLRAWPEIHRRTGARLRLVGADPLAVRLVLNREKVPDEGIDILGVLSDDELTAELLAAKTLVASSLGGESFGMVLTRALACAVPVVASDIPGYRAVVEPDIGVLVPPGDHDALAAAVVDMLDDEPLRQRRGLAGRELVQRRYAWERIAGQLLEIYEDVVERVRRTPDDRVRALAVGSRDVRRARGAAVIRALVVAWTVVVGRRRRVHDRQLAVGPRRDRAEPPLGRRAVDRVEGRHRSGVAAADAEFPTRLCGVLRRPLRRTPCSPAGSASLRESRC